MTKLFNQINLIERIDQLIRLRSTGNAKQLADKFNISESSVYRIIETIKELGAPVEYSLVYHSYVYTRDVNFLCGFFLKELSPGESKKVNGGFKKNQSFFKKKSYCQNLTGGHPILASEFSATL